MGCINSKAEGEPRRRNTKKTIVLPPSKTEVRMKDHSARDDSSFSDYDSNPSISNPPANPTDVVSSEKEKIYENLRDMMKTVHMPKIVGKSYSLVVAIDFGTAYSAYAYAHVDEKLNIMTNKNWEAEGAGAHFKTPTCLCVAENNPTQIHSFGLNAQRYSTTDDEEIKALNLKFFNQFKMNLYASNKVKRDMKIFAENDKNFFLDGLDVFAMAIKFLANHCLEHIKETGCEVIKNEILWVITVPAIWKDNQKMFMREAAVKAGIIEDIGDQNMMVALEPEAASVYCLSIYNGISSTSAPAMETDRKKASKYAQLVPKDIFMVADAGGGTIDITVYECLDNGTCKELICPVGGSWGGTLVNANFQKLLPRFYGEDFMEHLSDEYKSNLLDLSNFFETAKRQCNKNLDKPLHVNLGNIPALHKEFIQTFVGQYRGPVTNSEVKVSQNGKLVLSPPALQKLFDPVVQEIVQLVQQTVQRNELENLSMIFLVGGFSQCSYLENQLKQNVLKVRPDIHIVKPEEPILCVLRGAVMCGANPSLIDSRIAPRAYLLLAENPDGTRFFSTVIEKGSSVTHGYEEKIYAEPAHASMDYVQMDLYATIKDPPYKVSDKDIKKVCKVRVKCTAPSAKDNFVEFCFKFGGTEIQITGIHRASLTKVKATVDFLPG